MEMTASTNPAVPDLSSALSAEPNIGAKQAHNNPPTRLAVRDNVRSAGWLICGSAWPSADGDIAGVSPWVPRTSWPSWPQPRAGSPSASGAEMIMSLKQTADDQQTREVGLRA